MKIFSKMYVNTETKDIYFKEHGFSVLTLAVLNPTSHQNYNEQRESIGVSTEKSATSNMFIKASMLCLKTADSCNKGYVKGKI